MKLSLKGAMELTGHEGVALSPYYCSAGVKTIGVGATVSEIPDLAQWPLSRTITMEQAFDLLKKGIKKYEQAVNKALTRSVTQEQFDALVSWCYNVGTAWPIKATVIKLLNAGVTDKDDIYDALMRFNKPKEIVGRRKREALLLTEGKYQHGGKAMLFPVNERGKPLYHKGTLIDLNKYLANYE